VPVSVLWFRRDLRLADNPALLAAAVEADEVRPLSVMDPTLYDRAGAARPAYLPRSLRALPCPRLPDGPPAGHPEPIVDARAERAEALRRHRELRAE
jgi:deoxyribodipyrimidine photo-lyase